jgi:asparaginyl-tRNA synthetase
MELHRQSYLDIKTLHDQSDKWIGKIVTVCGWIKTCRIMGKKAKRIGFVELSDGSQQVRLQIIFDSKLLTDEKKEYFNELYDHATTGMSLKVIGLVVKSPAPEQPIELQAHEYYILGDIGDHDKYPVAKTELGLEYLRTIPHLRIKTDTFACIARIKSTMKMAFAEYFDKLGFFEVQVPLITDNECESGANPFTVTTLLGNAKLNEISLKEDKNTIDFQKDFFKKRCYLTVSGQLHLECYALALSKVWTMTTAFRAEASSTRMHLGEFWMLEQEFCFGTLQDNININEGAIKHCIRTVLSKCNQDLIFLQEKFDKGLIKKLEKYAMVPFIVTTHEECIKKMLEDEQSGKVRFETTPKYDDDLSKEHERYITDVMYNGTSVFVCNYPYSCKAFYMPKINKGDAIERVENFDMLMPELGEVVGGSQRETNYDRLNERMKEKGINPESLEFYSDLRKYGTVPHGGSGIGVDRLLMLMTGLNNIRDMIPFPRAYQECLY